MKKINRPDKNIQYSSQETELAKHYIDIKGASIDKKRAVINIKGAATELCSEAGSDRSGGGSCDCPAHVHDKELPLELVKRQMAETVDNVNYGYSSHFDF